MNADQTRDIVEFRRQDGSLLLNNLSSADLRSSAFICGELLLRDAIGVRPNITHLTPPPLTPPPRRASPAGPPRGRTLPARGGQRSQGGLSRQAQVEGARPPHPAGGPAR